MGEHEKLALGAIALSDKGLTDEQIEEATGLKHQSASARRNALVRKHMVKDSGERRATKSGRMAVVWMLGAGEPVTGAPNTRPSRPTAEEIAAAEQEIDSAMDALDWNESEALKKVMTWLRTL
jgi:hypothetical protein